MHPSRRHRLLHLPCPQVVNGMRVCHSTSPRSKLICETCGCKAGANQSMRRHSRNSSACHQDQRQRRHRHLADSASTALHKPWAGMVATNKHPTPLHMHLHTAGSVASHRHLPVVWLQALCSSLF